MLVLAVSGSVLIIALALFAYPYLIYPGTLALLRSIPVDAQEDSEGGDGQGVALLFCAFNERRALPEKIDNVRALKARYPKLQVLAFDDGSTDGTSELLMSHPELLEVVSGPGRSGKANGMKQLVAHTDADILVFTDANVLLDVECIQRISDCYLDPSVGGVCGSLHYLASDVQTATETSGGAYWRLEEKIKRAESRTGNVMGADGSIFSVRASLYPDFPDTVQDDFTVSMSVVFAGSRLIKAEDAIAYERLVSNRSDEASRKVRIAARAYHTHKFLAPSLSKMSRLDRYKYFAHKYLRWWGAVPAAFAVLAGTTFFVALGVVSPLILGVVAVVLILTAVVARRLVAVGIDFVVAVVQTFRGVMRANRGMTYAVWTPPTTR
ncbi:MAG TPA: histidine kinase [Microbacterium sp.]|uniref:glycosyltransferase n=1 Tax=unclassified Microbacterium TaxID=2609290 RepID=UPI000C500581|nr:MULTISPECIES: glycosyltransferase [unclassified Microbacterium]MBU19246.1 histidine kinase [Microbacterium sp.]HBS09305.1 histidine kinase [Microbacterium sp.]HBU41749.1 histidine kinase [Microbacterium sp.]|tara:strand:- start:8526 stop:9668 length:1143 start_codon:yes stop_codon:yes gene_type:complete